MKSNELHIEPVMFSKFTYNKERKSLSSYISNLNPVTECWFCRPLFNDAADVGIVIKSDKTGVSHRFYFDKHDFDGDEVAGWNFKPVDPKCPIQDVLIIND